MNVNYARVCRLCLSSRGEILPIFPTTSSDDSEPPVLASKIKECVSVQINENDDLPTNVCRKCMDNVNNWHIFKTVCERTQNKLHSLIKKDGSQLEEVNVKSEPLSDEAYDDGVVIDGSYHDPEHPGPSKLQPEGPPILASLGLTPRSDKKYVDPRMDWDRVHTILDIIQAGDPIDSLQSTEASDTIQQSDHESDSEAELLSLIDNYYINCDEGYLCKNDKVLSKTPHASVPAKVKTKQHIKKRKLNENCNHPKEAWKMLFSDDLLDIIVSATNENIQNNGKNKSLSTNVSEIRTLIGILYFQGIMRPTHQSWVDLWHEEYGVTCVRKAMNYSRFKFLLENLSFFDQDSDISMMQLDVMIRTRKVFEIFALNCRTAFEVKNEVAIDEILVPVYGPCPFRYEMKNKPLKCGIKMVLLVDPSSFYVSNLDVITDPYFEANEIVKKLVQHMSGTGKTVIMDSWFTSISLINKLKAELSLYTIGALNPKDEMIPPLFQYKSRECVPFMTGFVSEDITMASHVNSRSKCVTVLTNEPKFYKKCTKYCCPVTVYKKSQSAVEVVDVLMHYYTTMQYTNDWTLSLFFTMLNIASINAQVIWSSYQDTQAPLCPRRSFIRDLAFSLLEYNEPVENILDVLPKNTGTNYSMSMQVDEQSKNKKRKNCIICSMQASRSHYKRTRQNCLKCKQNMCKEHTALICKMCFDSSF